MSTRSLAGSALDSPLDLLLDTPIVRSWLNCDGGATDETPMTANARVLVVEDDHVNRLVVSKLLEVVGVIADVATNGAEALEAVNIRAYDLVLMDCNMPVMDGLEATRRIRQLMDAPTSASVPIVALTANSESGDFERCQDVGMNAHLTKPVDRQRLVETIERWVAR
jgi:two-component system, sensor histidine kinase and response regulator